MLRQYFSLYGNRYLNGNTDNTNVRARFSFAALFNLAAAVFRRHHLFAKFASYY